MSQPFQKGCQVPAPSELDEDLGEFWSGNPFDIAKDHNLSGYERNRTYLNVGGTNFVDISHISGTDTDADGRCAVNADINNDGMQDLIVRQAGGGALKIFRNNFPKKNWLRVSLRGTKSNRLGIGARLVAKTGNRQIVRELYPINTFRSQAPTEVHFGLGEAKQVDRLSILWPSGTKQEIPAIAANRHIRVTEGIDQPALFGN